MPKITKITSNQPGKTVAIFSGIHGNELAGQMAVKKLKENLELTSGTVYLVEANDEAIRENKRFVNKNLNRLFVRGKKKEVREDEIAEELMNLLDNCDALLDLHSYNDEIENRTVFAICEENGLNLVKTLEIKTAITGFTAMQEGGTDGYMNRNGKIGVCVELGSINISEEMSVLGEKIAKQFLSYFKLIEKVGESSSEKTILDAKMMYRKNTNKMVFTKNYKTFDEIPANTVFATDGNLELKTKNDSVILFPNATYDIGTEAFILAEKVHHN